MSMLRVARFGLILAPFVAHAAAPVPFETAMAGRTAATDCSEAMLAWPPAVPRDANASVATTPPIVEFVPTGPMEPWGQGHWSTWGDLLVAGNGKVYFALGDHNGIDGHCYLLEYDPTLHRLRVVVNVRKLLGLAPGAFGEGKIHGRLDQGRDGNLYCATYWGLGSTPSPLPAGWRGSHVLRYDPRTDQAEDLGAPFPGETWPMAALDAQRGNLFAVGVQDFVMCYNVYERRLLYGGALPHGWEWFARSTMIDPRTGRFYGSNRSINASERRTGKHTAGIICYDPETNRFSQTGATLPDNPVTGEKQDEWRAYTRTCDQSGAFYGCTDKGVLFRFRPDTAQTEAIDLNWGDGLYCAALALSPGGRYLYYSVAVHGGAKDYGAPVVQYDLSQRRKKVLAFLDPYYFDHYRYVMGGPFGTVLSPDGATLYMNWNGGFQQDRQGESFGDVALVAVHIPAAERVE